MKIEILGPGCPRCKMLEENVRKAVAETGVKADISKVTAIDKIIEYGIMSTPALVIGGEVKSSGKIADVAEIKKWLK